MAGTGLSATERAVKTTLEEQAAGERLVRLVEQTTHPLTEGQYAILAGHEDRLKRFGLKLLADLDGAKSLKSANVVGTYRFAGPTDHVIVQVDPKVSSADVFAMLDRTNRSLRTAGDDTEIPVADQPVSAVFLRFFATKVEAFLSGSPFRSYRFDDQMSSTAVKGRPLIQEYVTRSLPAGRSHVMPTRYLELSTDVFDNRVIAYCLRVAERLAVLLDVNASGGLRRDLLACSRLLVGVDDRRVTVSELRAHRYSRNNKRFEPIHRLCLTLLENETISFEAGARIPFASFTINMATLFQQYVSSVFDAVFGSAFQGKRGELTFETDFDRPIELDGLLTRGRRRTVIEAKYRTLDQDDDDLVLGAVPAKHVYQSVAYAGHREVRAGTALIVYPTWDTAQGAVRLSKAVSDFGWGARRPGQIVVRLVGIDLGSPFQDVVEGLDGLLANPAA